MTASTPQPGGWAALKSRLQQNTARRIIYIFLILAGGAFIAYTLYANWNEFKSQAWSFNYRYILLAILIYPAGMLPTVAGWHNLLQSMGAKRPFRTNLRLYSLSSLPRHIPGFVLFVTSRGLLYQEQGIPTAITVTATGAEIILLALTGFIISLSLLLLGSEATQGLGALRLVAPLAILVLLGLVLWTPGLNRLLNRLLARHGGASLPQLDQKKILHTLAWMFVAWAGGGLILCVLTQAIQPVSWSLLPVFIGMWGAAGAVSLTIAIGIQGLGIRENTLGALLSTILSPLVAIVIAVAFRLALTASEILWVLLFIWLTRDEAGQKKKEQPESG